MEDSVLTLKCQSHLAPTIMYVCVVVLCVVSLCRQSPVSSSSVCQFASLSVCQFASSWSWFVCLFVCLFRRSVG